MRGGNINDTQLNDQYRVPKPNGIKEVPAYLLKLFTTFFTRLGYIFKLVWEAKRSMLFLMVFMALFNGIMPVIGSMIGAELLNRLALVQSGAELAFSAITMLLVLQFGYTFFNSAVSRLYSMITSISGELVSNHVKMKIMAKAKQVDMVSFDQPDFYARMENANREAGMRPLQIMSSSFSVFSTVISIVSYIIVLFAVNTWAPFLIILVSIPTTIVNFVFKRKNVNYMFFRSKNRRHHGMFANN